jgi:hypothetical protein
MAQTEAPRLHSQGTLDCGQQTTNTRQGCKRARDCHEYEGITTELSFFFFFFFGLVEARRKYEVPESWEQATVRRVANLDLRMIRSYS